MESIFRTSSNKNIIGEITSILDENSIAYRIVDNEKDFDPGFVSNPGKLHYQILISDMDFDIANRSVADYYASGVQVPEDYYLYDYSDAELKEILFKKDEWNEFDYEAAKKILQERGESISEEELYLFDQARINSLKNEYEDPQEVKNYIIIGYILAVTGCILSLAWGMLLFVSYGIAIAILKLKKQLPNGERVYYFKEGDRKHGTRILWLSIVFTIFWTVFILAVKN